MLTSKQRAILRAQANGLDVVFQVGKGEIDDALVKSTADCLAARELIKMKVLENSAYSAKEAAAILAERTGSDVTLQAGSDLQETQTPQLLVLAQPYGQDTAVLSQSGLPLQIGRASCRERVFA